MIAYHGSTEIIANPDLKYSKGYLDFGRGFYMTSFRQQAENWAKRKALRIGGRPILKRMIRFAL